jgi:hypothetical protein
LESEADAAIQGSQIPRTRDEYGGLIFDHSFIGEGEEFGFPASEQFDGLSPLDQPMVLETFVDESGAVVSLAVPPNALNHGMDENGVAPPPPPAMDDPSDPPPAIDVEFEATRTRDSTDIGPEANIVSGEDVHRASLSDSGSDSPAAGDEIRPPPYLNDTVVPVDTRRPPPYVDVLLPTTSRTQSV